MNEDTDKTTEGTELEVQENIQEGEVVESNNGQSQTLILDSLESLIKENLGKIEKLKDEARNHKEMIDSALLNDEVYRNHEEAAKNAAKVKNATKAEVMKRPENATINQKLKDIKEEIKEIEESMSSYLQEYRRLSGSDLIENENGEQMQIVYKAVLVRRP